MTREEIDSKFWKWCKEVDWKKVTDPEYILIWRSGFCAGWNQANKDRSLEESELQ
jgi:hypothetical protein